MFLDNTKLGINAVGLLWTSNQFVIESANLHDSQPAQETNIHSLSGIQTRDLSNTAASELRLRPHKHWDRLECIISGPLFS